MEPILDGGCFAGLDLATGFNSPIQKILEDFDRYGVVELNKDYSIASFKEKQQYEEGLINGGLYVLNTKKFLAEYLPLKFSFEKDYLEKYFETRKIYGSVQDEYFIDIGVPEDFFRVQQELKHPLLELKNIDKEWTLFLDRDGVINYEKKDDYIRNWREFKFYEGVKDALKIFAQKFGIAKASSVARYACAGRPGSARVTRVGFGVTPKQASLT